MIEICIGSACHLGGSYEVIQRMKELIAENQLQETIELKASFCLGHCGKGVSIRLGGNRIYSIEMPDVDEFFRTHVLEGDY